MNRIVTIVGLRNNIAGLILTYPTITVPFATWLLMGFFKSIPKELEEAALVDGYNWVSAFIRVVMPLSLPGMISVTVFTFTLTLHEFIYAQAFVSSSSQRTISVGVPTELLLLSRGGCFNSNLLAAIRAHELEINDITIEVNGNLVEHPSRFDVIEMVVRSAHKDREMLEKLVTISERSCIVANTLNGGVALTVRVGE